MAKVGTCTVKDCVLRWSANVVMMDIVEIGLSFDIVVHVISMSSVVNGLMGRSWACSASRVITAIMG